MARKVWLCNLFIFALLVSADFAAGVDVAICTVSHPMPQNDADQEIAVLRDAIQGAVDLQLFGADDLDALADWVQGHTSSKNHILILTGILPTTLYASGNTEPDGSIVEEFLDAGNTIINTGEYTFYTIEGPQEANEDAALPNILDAPNAFVWHGREGWRDGSVTMTPTADGKKYTPSLEEYGTSYPIHVEDYEGTPWELELAVTENTEENLRVDGVIVNTETGGRLGIFVQAYVGDIPAPDISWGAVIGEYILNYYLREVADVQADGKLVSKWGEIRRF
jgi:hypothetical protein